MPVPFTPNLKQLADELLPLVSRVWPDARTMEYKETPFVLSGVYETLTLDFSCYHKGSVHHVARVSLVTNPMARLTSVGGLYIYPVELRRQQLGTKLLAVVAEWAADHNPAGPTILDVVKDQAQAGAVDFWHKNGWRPSCQITQRPESCQHSTCTLDHIRQNGGGLYRHF